MAEVEEQDGRGLLQGFGLGVVEPAAGEVVEGFDVRREIGPVGDPGRAEEPAIEQILVRDLVHASNLGEFGREQGVERGSRLLLGCLRIEEGKLEVDRHLESRPRREHRPAGSVRRAGGQHRQEQDGESMCPHHGSILAGHAEALNLPHESRAELVERLMSTLVDAPDSEVEQAWFEEAERRRQELLTGKVEGIPAETVFARLSAKLKG